MHNPIDLKSLTRQEISEHTDQMKLPKFRATQIQQWLFQHAVSSFEEMTNLSKDLRKSLSEEFLIRSALPSKRQESKDGTTKFLFELYDSRQIEAVLIPEFFDDGVADRLTVCVSSQVGCMFGCSFCATGKMGFHRHLTHGEIVDQILHVNTFAEEKFGKRITNIVYMGMGEPFHNYKAVVESTETITSAASLDLSPKRITVSTVGLAQSIKRIADEGRKFNLAISLHAAIDEKRNSIMPINEKTTLSALEESVKYYYSLTQKPVTYEYLLFDAFNDGEEDAKALSKIAGWVPSKVNIIMYNNVAGVELQRAQESKLNQFMRLLRDKGTRATVRRSRGDDIDAGCGQLAIRENQPVGKSLNKRIIETSSPI